MSRVTLAVFLLAVLIVTSGCIDRTAGNPGPPDTDAVIDNVENADSATTTETVTVTRFEEGSGSEYEWGHTRTANVVYDLENEELLAVVERDWWDWNSDELSEGEVWYKDGHGYTVYKENQSAEEQVYVKELPWENVSAEYIDSTALLSVIDDTDPEQDGDTYIYTANPDDQETRDEILDTLGGAAEFDLNKNQHEIGEIESLSAEVGVTDGYLTHATVELNATTKSFGTTNITVHVEYEEYNEPVQVEVPETILNEAE